MLPYSIRSLATLTFRYGQTSAMWRANGINIRSIFPHVYTSKPSQPRTAASIGAVIKTIRGKEEARESHVVLADIRNIQFFPELIELSAELLRSNKKVLKDEDTMSDCVAKEKRLIRNFSESIEQLDLKSSVFSDSFKLMTQAKVIIGASESIEKNRPMVRVPFLDNRDLFEPSNELFKLMYKTHKAGHSERVALKLSSRIFTTLEDLISGMTRESNGCKPEDHWQSLQEFQLILNLYENYLKEVKEQINGPDLMNEIVSWATVSLEKQRIQHQLSDLAVSEAKTIKFFKK